MPTENRFDPWSELGWTGFDARRVSQLSRSLHAIGVAATAERLRLKLRDRLLLTGAGLAVLEQFKRPERGSA